MPFLKMFSRWQQNRLRARSDAALPSDPALATLRWQQNQLRDRGDAIFLTDADLAALNDLSEHLFPEPWLELPNDLFGLLGFTVMAEQGGGIPDPAVLLKAIRQRAMLGAQDMPRLIANLRAASPKARNLVYLTDYLEEIQQKQAQDLFWPLIGRIDQYQAPPSTFNKLMSLSSKLKGNADLKDFTAHSFKALTPRQPLVEQTWLLMGLAVSWNLPPHSAQEIKALVGKIAAVSAAVADDPNHLLIMFGADPHPNAGLARAVATEIEQNQATYLYRFVAYLGKNLTGGAGRHFAKAITVQNMPLKH